MSFEDKIATLIEADLDITGDSAGRPPIDLNLFSVNVLKAIAKKMVAGWGDLEIARWANQQLVEKPELAAELGLDTVGKTKVTYVKAKAHIKVLRPYIMAKVAELKQNGG